MNLKKTGNPCAPILDETEIDLKMIKLAEGTKLDAGKDDYWLVPPDVMEEVVKVLTFGKEKYGEDNWKQIKNCEKRYYNACRRHLRAWRKGEMKDEETGLSHIAHAICSLIFLSWKTKQKGTKCQ